MISLLAIPIVGQATQATSGISSYFAQPIDAILFDIMILFGWIPIVITMVWGFLTVWLDANQGKYSARLKYILLAIDVPSATEQSPKALENLFSLLYGTKSSITFKEKWAQGRLHPVFSFEIVSTEGYIQFLIRTQAKFRDVVEAGIYAHYPDAEISEVEDYTKDFPREFPNETHEMWGGELTFDRPSMYPMKTYVDFEDKLTQEIKDPLGYTLEQMSRMKPGEHFWIQILVQPSTNDWKDEGIKYVKSIYGQIEKPKKSLITSTAESIMQIPSEFLLHATDVDLSGLLFGDPNAKEDDPWKVFKLAPPQIEEAKAILQKSTKVGHGVKIRIVYVAKKNAYVKVERVSMVKGILGQYSHLNLNRFGLHIPSVPKDDYFWMKWSYTKRQRTLMSAYCDRSWGVGANPIWLNAEELATLWHFPTIAVKAPLIKKAEARRAEPPVGLPITNLEETLPGYISEDQQTDEALVGLATSEDGEEDISIQPDEEDFEIVPEVIPPTRLGETQKEVQVETESIQTPIEELESEEHPLSFGEGALPEVAAPTKPKSEIQKDDSGGGGFAPPNLPI